jgi:hypothetical protein
LFFFTALGWVVAAVQIWVGRSFCSMTDNENKKKKKSKVGEGGEVLDDGTMKKRKRRKVKLGGGGKVLDDGTE